MTHAVRFVAVVAVLTALALCVPVQAQTPEIDALRARAEQGDAEAQYNLAASRLTGDLRDNAVGGRDAVAGLMTSTQIAEAQRLSRAWDTAHPRQP